MPTFSVDTKLFRELGALLVGRDSTALVELLKNAYDADATRVVVLGQQLNSEEHGRIIVADNGIGMSADEFSAGFLRIAGRSKNTADRRSTFLKRRFTGEKGVGRLAAHKLAHRLEVVSRRWTGRDPAPGASFPALEQVHARIDWDVIESLETLSEVATSNAVAVETTRGSNWFSGTRLTLTPLRKRWTETDIRKFFDEVATLTPPAVLTQPVPALFSRHTALVSQLTVRDAVKATSFDVHFEGDFSTVDSDLAAPAESASWIIEVDCNKLTRQLRIAVTPSNRTMDEYPNADSFVLERTLSADEPAVGFQSRILQREYESWPTRYQGVRIYFEGFRVLPYGDRRDDWLDLDRDYRSRGATQLGRLRGRAGWNLPDGLAQEGLAIQGNTAFFGAVFLTRSGADELEMLINREGFLPSQQFNYITDTIRLAIDLQVRLRYAATSGVKQARKMVAKRQATAARKAASGEGPSAYLLRDLQRQALSALRVARTHVSAGDTAPALATLEQIEQALQSTANLTEEAASEATMFRVVASLGLEHAAFVHEVRSLALSAQAMSDALERLAETAAGNTKARLRVLASEARDLRERLRRNAIYLADVTGVEGRRRRSRQKLRERVDQVIAFFGDRIERKKLHVDVRVATTLETPPLFPAELISILSNLISNAVKFTDENGSILVRAKEDEDYLKVNVENSGEPVDLLTSDRWFEPFQSTTANVDETLGQGMGLGLTITRSLLDEYGGHIKFIRASGSYSTAIEAALPIK